MPFKTIMLFSTLTAFVLFVGWLLAGAIGVILALILAGVVNLISYMYSDKLVLRLYHAKPYHERRVMKMVEHMAMQAKIPVPRLYMVDSVQPNAFATGRDPHHAAIAITSGILSLDDKELEAVIAHEMGHIANRDILISSIAAMLAGTLSFLAQMAYYSVFMGEDRRDNSHIIGIIIIIIFAPVAAMIVRFAISRLCEFKADEASAMLTKDPHALISALKKIHNSANSNPIHGNAATSHMWIVNPFRGDWFISLFSTHPPLDARIEHLEEFVLH